VSNRALAIICVESGLHRFLMHDTPHLTQSIKSFVEEIEACKHEAKTDAQRLKYWSTLQAPKVKSIQCQFFGTDILSVLRRWVM
jgi:endoribonuclease Dicer